MIFNICAIILIFFLILNIIDAEIHKTCIRRDYMQNSFVCVCNSTYCDEIPRIQSMKEGNYVLYSSDMKEKRFEKTTGTYRKNNTKIFPSAHTIIKINRMKTFQKIFGFGGSFTDATVLNIAKLRKRTQKQLLKSYFGENGLEYNMARIPIGATDFSTRFYAYNMQPENDIKLSNYSLAEEDLKYRIPMILYSTKMSTDKLYLLAASWYSPNWMRYPYQYGITQIKFEYYQTWADYHIRFLEEYQKYNISFWAISTGNEPTVSILPVIGIENLLGWLPRDQGYWILNHFGPTVRNSSFSNITILGLDDQRMFVPWWFQKMEHNEGVMKYIDGIALHWYADFIIPISVVDSLHNLYPDLFIISTESSIDIIIEDSWNVNRVSLGSWNRAERYARNIIEDLNKWFTGWIDWNMVLDLDGGPNWSRNFVDGPIIIDEKVDEFFKQPMFYAMGHFSKFIPRNSLKIDIYINGDNVLSTAFLRKDNGVIVVLLNLFDDEKKIVIQEQNKTYIELTLSPRSIHTLIYW